MTAAHGEQVAAVLREDHAARHGADVSGPRGRCAACPDATDGGASICTTRSTAPMSIPSSSEDVATIAGSSSALQPVLDLEALLPRDRAVVRERDLLARCLVQRGGEPLREPPAVDEDHRRAVRADELDETRVDRRPDRAARGRSGGGSARRLEDLAQRDSCPRRGPRPSASNALRLPASTISTGRGFAQRRVCRPARRRREGAPTSSSGRWVAERPMRWRGRPRRSQRFEPLEREEEVRAALASPTSEWISSTMTVSTESSISRADDVRRR